MTRRTKWSTRWSSSTSIRRSSAARAGAERVQRPGLRRSGSARHPVQPRLRLAARRRRARGRDRSRGRVDVGRRALQPSVVRAARLRDSGDEPQPPPGAVQRRRHRTHRRLRTPIPVLRTGSTPRAAPRCSPRSVGFGRPRSRACARQLVPRARLTEHLPRDTATVDALARRDEVRRRAAHTAWRYRS